LVAGFHPISKEELIATLLKLFQKLRWGIEVEVAFPNSLYEAITTLIPVRHGHCKKRKSQANVTQENR
jgi:hypothetical protein